MYCEREKSLDEAESNFLSEMKKLQLHFDIRKMGHPPLETVTCTLYCNHSQKKVAEGWGKGYEKQSILSAKFEALELFTGQATNVSSPHKFFSLQEIPDLFPSIFPEFLAHDFPRRTEKMPWIQYYKYGSDEKVYIPAICTHPFYRFAPFPGDNFSYDHLYLSITTNGIATGSTFTESLIHAILEVIERHSTSLFLISTFIKGKNPKIIDMNTLPKKQKEIADHLIRETGFNLTIFHMPNEMNLPSYGAVLHRNDVKYPIKGYGASLDPSYAVQRAMLEAVEAYHADENHTEMETVSALLAKWPILKKCAYFDLPHLIKKKCIEPVPFEESNLTFNSLQEYLMTILDRLKEADFSLYIHELYRSESLSTVRVIIPEAEEFFAVEKGLIVPIRSRGAAILYG